MNLKWAKQIGASESGYDKKSIAVDAEGNIYTSGSFTGMVDFDPGPGEFYLSTVNMSPFGGQVQDMFVSKSDAAGNLIWAKQMASEYYARSNSLAIDAQGNVYTIGEFTGTVDFDPGVGIFNLSSAFYSFDMFMSKLDRCGNFVWAKQIGGITNDHVYGNSITLDARGNIYVTGNFDGNAVDFDPGTGVRILNQNTGISSLFVSKFNANGNLVWAKQTVAHSEYDNVWGAYSESITTDASGNVYTTGFFGGTIDFDPGDRDFLLNNFFGNNFILKLDSSGLFLWANQMGQTSRSFVWGKSIAIDVSGNVYTSGYFLGSVDFDPGPGIFNLSTINPTLDNLSLYVSKLNSSGSFVWAKQVGGPGSMAIRSFPIDGSSTAIDTNGNIYTTGAFSGTVDFDPGAGVHNLTAAGKADIFVSKLDLSGNFVWVKQMACTNSSYSGGLVLDATGNIYTTGAFSGTIDFDPGPGVYDLTSAGSSTNIFINKMTHCTSGNTSYTKNVSTCSSYVANCGVYTSSGVYTQTFLSASGCDSIVTLNLTIGNTNATSAIDLTVCNSYSWNGQTLTSSGVFKDTLIAVNGCDSIVTLRLVIKPQSSSVINETICHGQNYQGHTTSGTYVDTLIAANGCDSMMIVQLNVVSKPAPDLGVDRNLCAGDSLILNPGQFNDYLWQDGSIQNSLIVNRSGLYSVVVTNNCGSAGDEVLIKDGNCKIHFPSGFTPNNDGQNDYFRILGANNLKDYHLVIYNRWGQRVFESFDFTKGWNGNFKGQSQSSATFVWVCEFKESGRESKTKLKGTVTLIR